MYDVRDFTFVMIPTAEGETRLNIRYMEKDVMEEFTFKTAQLWIMDVKDGFSRGSTVAQLIREFKEDWWNRMFYIEIGSVRKYWNDKGYSVDDESLKQSGRDLISALRAFAEGARLFNVEKRQLKGWDVL